MTTSSNDTSQQRGGRDGIIRTAERIVVLALVTCGIILIAVPLILTLYLSVFDEKLILFPPRGYTLDWYPAILPNFRVGSAVTFLPLVTICAATAATVSMS